MDLGFIQAGFDIVWANDIIPEAIETYRNNVGKHIIFGDIRMINSKSPSFVYNILTYLQKNIN